MVHKLIYKIHVRHQERQERIEVRNLLRQSNLDPSLI